MLLKSKVQALMLLPIAKAKARYEYYINYDDDTEEQHLPTTGTVKPQTGKPLNIYLLTFNTNSQPPPANIGKLFDFDLLGSFDLYAIGLLEVSYSSLIGANEFKNKFLALFQQKGYVELVSERHLTIDLNMFVRKDSVDEYSDIEVSHRGMELIAKFFLHHRRPISSQIYLEPMQSDSSISTRCLWC